MTTDPADRRSTTGLPTSAAGTSPDQLAGLPATADAGSTPPRRPPWHHWSSNERFMGWLFVVPALAGILVFLALPMGMSLYVSFRDWTGLRPMGTSNFIGLENYRDLLVDDSLVRRDFATAIRNNFYYVLGVVPVQTTMAFVLAVIVNNKVLKGKTFFRATYYFPSITSSVAIGLVFIFLFQTNGAINALFGFFGLPDNIRWLSDASGLLHNVLGYVGVDEAPTWMAETTFLSLPLWEWVSGPSVTMFGIMLLATWTTTGTLMLIFLAGLQNISLEVEEASKVDGASTLQHFFKITLPLMKPTLFFVLTIGLIGTWQVFDQIYVISGGGPQKTTLTPAYLVYRDGFQGASMGRAAAISFLLFILIITLTLIQRRVLRTDDD
jgi:multiple sugar transport system permease protein